MNLPIHKKYAYLFPVIGWMLLWATAKSFMGISVKMLRPLSTTEEIMAFPPAWMAFFRTFFQLSLLLPWLVGKKSSTLPAARYWLWLVGSSFLGAAAIFTTYVAYGSLKITLLTAVGFLDPSAKLFFSAIFLGLYIAPITFFWSAIGYLGVFMIKYITAENSTPLPSEEAEFLQYGFLMSIFSNLLAGMAGVLTKKIQEKIHLHQLLLYGNLLLLPIFGVYSYLYEPKVMLTAISYREWGWLLLLATSSLIGRYAYLQALQIAHFDTLVPLSYIQPIFILGLAPLIVPSESWPSWKAMIGIAIVLWSNYQVISSSTRNKKKTIQACFSPTENTTVLPTITSSPAQECNS